MAGSKILFSVMVLSLFLFTACIDQFFDEMFAGVPGYEGSSSSSSSGSTSSSSGSTSSSSSSSGGGTDYYTFTDKDGNQVTILDNKGSKADQLGDKVKNFFGVGNDEPDLSQNELSDSFDCSHIDNSHENAEGTCVCNSGYTNWYGLCKRTGGKSCRGDWDCGRPYCSGYYKVVPRCDLRSESCITTDRINCKEDFGPGASCRAGLCVAG